MSKILIETATVNLALGALEKMARLTSPLWALENNYAGHLEAITALKSLAEQPAPAAQEPSRYFDSAPDRMKPFLAMHGIAPQEFNAFHVGFCCGEDFVKEQPAPVQQEPVAVVSGYYGGQCVILPIDPARIFNSNTALYTSPPAQRKPLDLTAAIEYADARRADVEVPVEWCRYFADALALQPAQRTWVVLMRGVRVEGDTVVITVKGGNDAARELCGALLKEKNT